MFKPINYLFEEKYWTPLSFEMKIMKVFTTTLGKYKLQCLSIDILARLYSSRSEFYKNLDRMGYVLEESEY